MKHEKPSLRELLSRGDLIDPEELAAGMRVARVTVYQWVRRGVIPHLKIEGLVRFDPQEIEVWLKNKHREAPYSLWPPKKSNGRRARKEAP